MQEALAPAPGRVLPPAAEHLDDVVPALRCHRVDLDGHAATLGRRLVASRAARQLERPQRQLYLDDRGVSREAVIADNEVVLTGETDKAAALLALHTGPGFVLPNAWDPGSARILEQVGFAAIATTSAGIAWARGVPDGGAVDRETMLAEVARITTAVGVPVTADLENGYGATAADVAHTVALAVGTGAVGGNLEDAGADGLFGIDEAAERIAAARSAAPRGTFVLNARTDT